MKKIISTLLICVLLIGCVAVLAACGAPSSDPKEAKANLEEEGYIVELRENVEGYAATLYAYKNNVNQKKFDEIYIYYFKDSAAANKAWETMEDAFAKEAEPTKDTDYEIEYGIDDKLIYKGTVDAVSAAK